MALSRSTRIVFPLVILAILAAAYAGYWYWLASRLDAGIDEWIATSRAQGYQVSHGRVTHGGFPLRVEARLDQPLVARQERGIDWEWRAEGLAVAMPVHRYDEIVLRSLGASRLSYKAAKGAANSALEKRTILTPSQAEVRFVYDAVGVKTLDLAWKGIAIAQEGTAPVHLALLSLRQSAVTPSGTKGPGIFVAVRVESMQIPGLARTPLGGRIGLLEAQGTIDGPLSEAPVPQALTRWRDAGGILDLTRLQLVWGAMRVAGSGTLALDEAARPMGAFSLRIAGYNWLIDQFVTAGKLAPAHAELARSALAALAQERGNQEGVPVPIRIQSGRVFLGPVRVAKVEPLF